MGVLGLSNTTSNRRDRTEVVQEEEDLELGKGGEPTRNSKPTRRLTTSDGSDSSGIRALFTFNKTKKKEEENNKQLQRRRQSRRDSRGDDEYHWNEVNINQSSDSDTTSTRRKKIAAFFKYCCRIPTLVVLLVLLLGSIATVISIIILRRGGERSGDSGIKLDGFNPPTSSPTNTKLVNACVCYPINNTTNNTTNSTPDNNTPPSTTINSGVYDIGGVNYQCLEDDSIAPEYLTICIYPTFNIFSDKYNMDGYNYGKTNEQVINVDGDVTVSTFGELTAVQLSTNINTEINVVGVTSFGTLNVNNLDLSLLNTDLKLEEEIMNYYEDAIKMGKFYINILIIVYLLFGWFMGGFI